MRTRRVEGRTVAWREAGRGAPALLLHCGLARSGAFKGMIERLEDVLAMRAVDLPGHGGTDYDPARDQQDQAVANARVLLADRGPAHLVAHSFGATVALRLAIEAPASVASATLIEPVQYSLLEEAGHLAYATEIAAQAPFHAAAAAGDWRTAAELFLTRWGAGGGLAAMKPRLAAYTLARLPLIVASEPAILTAATARVRLADVARVACPVLLVAGADSPAAVHAILDVIAAALPRAHRLTVPGAGHMVPVSHPGEVSGALRDFLAPDDAQEAGDLGLGGRPVADQPG